jgi:hypothetical protein
MSTYRRGGSVSLLSISVYWRTNEACVSCNYIMLCLNMSKINLSLWQAVEVHRAETLRLPHFLDNRLTHGGEVVSLTRRPAALYPHTPRKIPGTHFCWRLSQPQGHSAAGMIR